MIPKVLQSILLLILETFILFSYTKLKDKNFSLSVSHQERLTKLIFISNMVEYAFLAMNIYLILKTVIVQRKRKTADERYKRYIEDSNSVLVYKTVECAVAEDQNFD